MNTDEAVDHDKHGTNTKGFGQFVALKEAIWPPIDKPVTPSGPKPIFSHQCNSTKFSRTRQPPITNISDTLFKFDRLKLGGIVSIHGIQCRCQTVLTLDPSAYEDHKMDFLIL